MGGGGGGVRGLMLDDVVILGVGPPNRTMLLSLSGASVFGLRVQDLLASFYRLRGGGTPKLSRCTTYRVKIQSHPDPTS